MCVSLFSTIAHAEKIQNYVVEIESFVKNYHTNGNWFHTGSFIIDPLDDVYQLKEVKDTSNLKTGNSILYTYNFATIDNSIIAEQSKVSNISLDYIYYSSYYPAFGYFREISEIKALLSYTDGTAEYITEGIEYNQKDAFVFVDFSIKPDKDVKEIKLFISGTGTHKEDKNYEVIQYLGEIEQSGQYQFSLNVQSEEAGLLEDISGSVQEGFNKVETEIKSLPEKIWEKISNGLKSLFVPSEESMTAYKDKWDELLASRFGAVYQVVNIMTDSWDGIMQADQTDTINFPQASINFSGTPFTFGGYDVKIVPDGFGVLVTAIKSIVAIVCTVAFVNGMRKRYDEIMGVEQ